MKDGWVVCGVGMCLCGSESRERWSRQIQIWYVNPQSNPNQSDLPDLQAQMCRQSKILMKECWVVFGVGMCLCGSEPAMYERWSVGLFVCLKVYM